MTDHERRMNARATAHNVVTYVSIGKKRVTAAIENMSAGGVFLRSSMVAPVGTQLGLEFFEGERGKTLMVPGIVISVVGPGTGSNQQPVPGMGVKFGDRTLEQHRRISALIESIEVARDYQPSAPLELARVRSSVAPAAGPGDASAGPVVKRRRNRRVPTKDATAHVRMKGDVVALSVPVTNVSMGGLFLQTTDPLPMGALIEVELRLGGQSMVLSGEIVGAVPQSPGAARDLAPGISLRFGPMARRNANRLRTMLAALSPGVVGGFDQEIVPGGFTAEPVSGVSSAVVAPPVHLRSNEFDYSTRDLADLTGEAEPNEPLVVELNRLRAEIRTREERIAVIEKTLRGQPR